MLIIYATDFWKNDDDHNERIGANNISYRITTWPNGLHINTHKHRQKSRYSFKFIKT